MTGCPDATVATAATAATAFLNHEKRFVREFKGTSERVCEREGLGPVSFAEEQLQQLKRLKQYDIAGSDK